MQNLNNVGLDQTQEEFADRMDKELDNLIKPTKRLMEQKPFCRPTYVKGFVSPESNFKGEPTCRSVFKVDPEPNFKGGANYKLPTADGVEHNLSVHSSIFEMPKRCYGTIVDADAILKMLELKIHELLKPTTPKYEKVAFVNRYDLKIKYAGVVDFTVGA